MNKNWSIVAVLSFLVLLVATSVSAQGLDAGILSQLQARLAEMSRQVGRLGQTGMVLGSASTSDLPIGGAGQTLRHNGTGWVATSNLLNDGANVSILPVIIQEGSTSTQPVGGSLLIGKDLTIQGSTALNGPVQINGFTNMGSANARSLKANVLAAEGPIYQVGSAITNLIEGSVTVGSANSTNSPASPYLDGVKLFINSNGMKLGGAAGQTRPACSTAYRGVVWLSLGLNGTADTLDVCMFNANGTFSWRNLTSGTTSIIQPVQTQPVAN